MKKLEIVLTICMAILIILMVAQAAQAADVMLDTKIDSVTVATGKDGSEYVRFIITEARTLQGAAYNTTLAVMSFGDQVELAKAYKAGDDLKAVAQKRSFQGRDSYIILSFIE